MKNLKSLSDSELLSETRSLVTEEKRIALEILHLLDEIDRRRLHIEIGYASLFTFCVSELKYTESQAFRRIGAMRALREIPEIEQALQSGALSITVPVRSAVSVRAPRRMTPA